MSLEDLDLRELCTKAKEAGACSVPYKILRNYSSVKDLVDRNPEKAAEWAYWYALYVIRDRWPEAEPVIMADPYWTYCYALDVVKGRWPEAEPVIMMDPKWAYYYALHVIGGRWPEAEPVIMTDPHWADLYNRNVLQKGDSEQ